PPWRRKATTPAQSPDGVAAVRGQGAPVLAILVIRLGHAESIAAPLAVLDLVRGRPAGPRGAWKGQDRGDRLSHGWMQTTRGSKRAQSPPINSMAQVCKNRNAPTPGFGGLSDVTPGVRWIKISQFFPRFVHRSPPSTRRRRLGRRLVILCGGFSDRLSMRSRN